MTFDPVPIAQMLTPIVFGSFAAIITYRQWRTAKDKLDLDLFDRRWAIYDGAHQFCRAVMRDFKPSDDDYTLLRDIKQKAEILFDARIGATLKTMGDLAASLDSLTKVINSGTERERLTENVARQQLLIEQFMSLFNNLPRIFRASFGFSHLR